MQLVATDIGNSTAKCMLEKDSINGREFDSVCTFALHKNQKIDFNDPEFLNPDPAFWSVSSVNTSLTDVLCELVKAQRPQDEFHVITASEVPLDTNVESRDRLGRDRLIAGWMATQLNGSGPLIVVDAGTAVTIDLISWEDSKPVFEGGFIFPGARASLSSLKQSTNALPDLSQLAKSSNSLKKGFAFQIGRSTEEAIIQGVYQSQIQAIKGMVSQLLNSQPNATVFSTGGGIKSIRKQLPSDWKYVYDLVLRGAAELGRRAIEARK